MKKFFALYKSHTKIINYSLIVLLSILLVKIAYFDPKLESEVAEYYKSESRLRMHNLRCAQRAYFEKNKRFCGKIDELIAFVNSSEAGIIMDSTIGLDSALFSFKLLSNGELTADSLKFSTKVHTPYPILLDTVRVLDSVFSKKGEYIRVDTSFTLGSRFKIIDPSGYGSVGNLYFDATKFSASWE
jgi:hypothetical protein